MIGPLLGQHFCGPEIGFTEGTKFPGVPLHADTDGICNCCLDLHFVCGPHVDMEGIFLGTVTVADPLNTLFVVGFQFFFRWNTAFPGWKSQDFPDTGPGSAPHFMWFRCQHEGASNVHLFVQSTTGGYMTTSETLDPFSLTYTNVQYAIHGPPPPGGKLDFFDFVVTKP